MPPFFHTHKKYIIIGLIAILIVIFFDPLSRIFKTSMVYTNFVIREGEWRPLQLLTSEPEVRDSLIFEGAGVKLRADLYLPAKRAKLLPAMVLFAPLVFETSKDPRIKNTAETFARAGFVILVPDKPEGEGTSIGSQDLLYATRAYEYLRSLDEVDENRVAYFGLSYGAGPVLLAAADIEPPPEFVATFGGYVELLDEIKFALTGGYEYQDIKDKLEPEPWLRDITIKNLLGTFPKEPGLDALIANTDPDEFDQLYAALSNELKETVDDLSPHRIVHQLDMPLYILHSTDDNVVPYTESVKFFDMVSSRTEPATTLSLVSIFTHGEFKKVNASNLFKEYLPSLRDSIRFIYNVLNHA